VVRRPRLGPPVPLLRHTLGEARFAGDWVRGRLVEDRLARHFPGDGRTIMVIPGLFTSDLRTAGLRRVLRKAGYRAHGWGLGRNMPIRADLLDRLDVRLDELQAREEGPVTLIGWSLGGLVAREYAKHAPERVGGVITMGTPFSGDPRANRAWRVYEMVADHKVDAPPIGIDRSTKPPVHTTALWSARDGIIAAESARGLPHERDVEMEIRCGHFAMSSAPDALEAVLKSLSRQSKKG
jgi:pimeloyl-ACP methyl ester carboxylesterase